MIADLRDIDWLEIKIVRHPDGNRVWLNGPYGLLFRAYRVKRILLQQSYFGPQETRMHILIVESWGDFGDETEAGSRFHHMRFATEKAARIALEWVQKSDHVRRSLLIIDSADA